jgi:enamine deaminase RidA (YjgF/YER057c/UK114 family)
MTAYRNLERLAITLPPIVVPSARFEPYVRDGNLLYLSGHIARRDGAPWRGQLGRDMTVEQGKEAARSVAVDLLGTLHAATGDLDRIARILKLLVFVNATPDFTEPHVVANGASELLAEVLGEKGTHARSAVCAAQLPFGTCVEIELIAAVTASAP